MAEIICHFQTISVDRSRLAIVGDGTPGGVAGSLSTYEKTPRYPDDGRTPLYSGGGKTPMYGGQTPMYGTQTPMHEGFVAWYYYLSFFNQAVEHRTMAI